MIIKYAKFLKFILKRDMYKIINLIQKNSLKIIKATKSYKWNRFYQN